MRKGLIIALVATVAFCGGATLSVENASAHRARCHQAHTCPSDHATYRWRGWLCVAPYSDRRNATFKRRIVYSGRVYWCKR